MKNYEVLYIIENSVSDEGKENLINKFSSLVTDNGGSVAKIDKWGTKKFAYPINYKTEGYYVLMEFESEPTLPAEMDRQMRISDDIIRSMITVK
ncbi:MAG: 30S ribosomal protein S6 [Christensenellales bacterium]